MRSELTKKGVKTLRKARACVEELEAITFGALSRARSHYAADRLCRKHWGREKGPADEPTPRRYFKVCVMTQMATRVDRVVG